MHTAATRKPLSGNQVPPSKQARAEPDKGPETEDKYLHLDLINDESIILDPFDDKHQPSSTSSPGSQSDSEDAIENFTDEKAALAGVDHLVGP
ncbi:hypothetical protein BGX20_005865, partial [Mortierella sp. AD010]